MHLTFLGAAGTVTGSCTLVKTEKAHILIDCGMQQDGEACNSSDFDFNPAALTAVILTHGHLDHSGRIPLLFKHGFAGMIYGHYATCELARLIWRDTVSLGEQTNGSALYSEKDVGDAGKNLIALSYNIPIQVGDSTITFHDAGHILGSSHVVIESGGKRILFSGDIGCKGTPIIRDPHESWEGEFDAAVIESTYGDRNHKDRKGTVAEFESIVTRVVESRGVLLIPSFAIGRVQEMLYHLNTLIESKKIPPLPVFVDSPMASKTTSLYRRSRDCYDIESLQLIESGDMPLVFPGLQMTATAEESRGIETVTPPFIVIAGSGMCNGGRILGHIQNFAHKKSTTLMFVGFQGKGTLGRRLVDGETKISINNQLVSINCEVSTLNGFSAHADQAGLLAWAMNVPGKNIKWFVNHGEPKAASTLAGLLGKNAVAVARNYRTEI